MSNERLKNIVVLGRLKDARLKAGLSRNDIDDAHIRKTSISLDIHLIESGVELLSVQTMFFLCALYNVRPSYIVSGMGVSSKSEYAQAIKMGYAQALEEIEEKLNGLKEASE